MIDKQVDKRTVAVESHPCFDLGSEKRANVMFRRWADKGSRRLNRETGRATPRERGGAQVPYVAWSAFLFVYSCVLYSLWASACPKNIASEYTQSGKVSRDVYRASVSLLEVPCAVFQRVCFCWHSRSA